MIGTFGIAAVRENVLVRFQPGAPGAELDSDRDLVRECKRAFHRFDDLGRQGLGLGFVKVEEQFVMDLEKHFRLCLLSC